ncbi:MAG: hypothetical protein GEV09_01360 [Pseudonocardiaceae bacterium]|nr:hypothetical protein [Pseudonocardiaceae bacterium]
MSAPMVAALEQAWVAIRARHPEVPAAVVVLGAGSIGSPAGGLRLGHFAAMRWHHDEQQLPEVFIGGEGLNRCPADVLATLLHEAAHALANVRGIKDTSRQGRWHNARFKQLAAEVGIETTKDPRLGWSPTTLPEATRTTYADTIAALGAALRMHRSAELTDGRATKTKAPPTCVCDCGRRIRFAPTVLAAGPITCVVCGTDFAPEDDGS